MKKLFFLALMTMSLAACSEVQFIAQSYKDLSNQQAGTGQYKIGKPYNIDGVKYYPQEEWDYVETGIASWYGPQFHGKSTANGEVFNMWNLTAAHRTLPMPSMVKVTNLSNGRSIHLRVNDRGPFAHGRIIDVSRRAAQLLGFEQQGTAKVRVEILTNESLAMKEALTGEKTQVASVARENVSVPPPTKPVDQVELLPPPETLAQQEKLVEVEAAAVKPTSMYIQIASFSNVDNASKLGNKLTNFGQTKIIAADIHGQQFHRVRIGPMNDLAATDQLLERLIDEGYTDARIVVD